MSRRLRRRYGCPVEFAVDLLGGKWKTVILARMKAAPLTYAELRRLIPGLSDKVLSEKLRELVELGLVEQTAGADLQPRRYRLTARGRELAPALEALYQAGALLSEPLAVSFADPPERRQA